MPEEDYVPLLYILGEHLNERGIAHLRAICFDLEFSVVGNDFAKTQSIAVPKKEEVERVKEKLAQGGFAEWAAEE